MCSPSAVYSRELQHHSMSSCGLDVSDSTAASNFGLVFSFSGLFWSSEAYSSGLPAARDSNYSWLQKHGSAARECTKALVRFWKFVKHMSFRVQKTFQAIAYSTFHIGVPLRAEVSTHQIKLYKTMLPKFARADVWKANSCIVLPRQGAFAMTSSHTMNCRSKLQSLITEKTLAHD